jgi:hypothetical protein
MKVSIWFQLLIGRQSRFKTAIPLLFHPIDARHRQALASGIAFENPVGHQVLNESGFEALLFLGQRGLSRVDHLIPFQNSSMHYLDKLVIYLSFWYQLK